MDFLENYQLEFDGFLRGQLIDITAFYLISLSWKSQQNIDNIEAVYKLVFIALHFCSLPIFVFILAHSCIYASSSQIGK